jgi:hypothetical protein
MRITGYLSNDKDRAGLYVSPDGRWSSQPAKGFTYKTREEILGGPQPEKKAEKTEEVQTESVAQKTQEKAEAEITTKKTKKNK